MEHPKDNPIDRSSKEHHHIRKKLEQDFQSVGLLLHKPYSSISQNLYIPFNDKAPSSSHMTSILSDIRKVGFKDVETLLEMLHASQSGLQNDKTLLLEDLVQVLAKIPPSSSISKQLTDAFISKLWYAQPHPVLSSLGTKYKYREADGSNNNIQFPDYGKAGSAYARAAKPSVLMNIELPDPGEIFDSLMDPKDFNNSLTSSYLDLAPLYGSNQDEQNMMRTFQDGKLKPDCFSEKRILGFPPGVGVLLIMFNRFHNYVVTCLLLINESDRFTKPREDAPKATWDEYDNDLFQTGRLITTGLYVNIIMKDYVRTILSLNRTDSKWDLDPRTEQGKSFFSTSAPEGTGNQVSAEFNLIYRWHSAISEQDDLWTQSIYAKWFPGRKPEDIPIHELLATLREMDKQIPDEPLARPFANLERLPDGTYPSTSLVNILTSSITSVAGSFGANRIPKSMRAVEILGIIQARSWNIASLNEFRAFSGLTPHATFEDINPDPIVAEKLRTLYDHPDRVELYPGLVAEKPKPPMSPGSGLCVNFTTSFHEIQVNPINDGVIFYKLVLNAFPDNFQGDSIYAHFPFVIPSESIKILKSLNRAHKYSWDLPSLKPQLTAIKSYASCRRILEDTNNWKCISGEAISVLRTPPDKGHRENICLSGDEKIRRLLIRPLYPTHWTLQINDFCTQTTLSLLSKYSYPVPGTKNKQVDLIRDISNLAFTHIASALFNLPLKTEDMPRAVYTEQEMYSVLASLHEAVYFEMDTAKSFEIRESAKILMQRLGKIIQVHVESIRKGGSLRGRAKIEMKMETDERLPTAVSLTATQSHVFAQTLDYYLGAGISHLPRLYELSHTNTKEADDLILRYVLEASRIHGTLSLYRRNNTTSTISISDAGNTHLIPTGGTVLLTLDAASLDPYIFPSPESVDLHRPFDSYLLYHHRAHSFGQELKVGFMGGLVAICKVIFGLKGLRRAKSGGHLKSMHIDGRHMYMTADWRMYSALPCTMRVAWDEQ
ncbi:hypothetical protein B7494_g7707 [Chlorociboria aeruginascens]|nr:hypothetical protein B7494_g7707 [Chlorociboria aeruginascens]